MTGVGILAIDLPCASLTVTLPVESVFDDATLAPVIGMSI